MNARREGADYDVVPLTPEQVMDLVPVRPL